MIARMAELIQPMTKNPAPSDAVVQEVLPSLPQNLSGDYIELIKACNGAEGFVGGDGAYLVLWRLEDLVPWNHEYRSSERFPGLFIFGSDGGDEAFAFDTVSRNVDIVSVPFMDMRRDNAYKCGTSFLEFLEWLATDPDWPV